MRQHIKFILLLLVSRFCLGRATLYEPRSSKKLSKKQPETPHWRALSQQGIEKPEKQNPHFASELNARTNQRKERVYERNAKDYLIRPFGRTLPIVHSKRKRQETLANTVKSEGKKGKRLKATDVPLAEKENKDRRSLKKSGSFINGAGATREQRGKSGRHIRARDGKHPSARNDNTSQ